MKTIGKWLAKVLATVVSLLLVIVLLPYAFQLSDRMLPDLSERAETASQVLAQRFEESARLETVQVSEEGVFTSSTRALFLGTVQQVTIRYLYEASLGIDLRRVTIEVDKDTLTLILPDMEVLADSLTPQQIDRRDFWYPLTDKQREAMLGKERDACRARYLADYAASEEAWHQTCRTMDETIAQWLGDASGLTIVYAHEEAQEQAPEI